MMDASVKAALLSTADANTHTRPTDTAAVAKTEATRAETAALQASLLLPPRRDRRSTRAAASAAAAVHAARMCRDCVMSSTSAHARQSSSSTRRAPRSASRATARSSNARGDASRRSTLTARARLALRAMATGQWKLHVNGPSQAVAGI